jgi:hypothetical protein
VSSDETDSIYPADIPYRKIIRGYGKMAASIGPAQIVSVRYRSFCLDGYPVGGISWQCFIARLCAHGYFNIFVPGFLLQIAPGLYTIRGPVADDVENHML